ncbi:DUF1152 domain-containing protein [Microbacterium sp.]|uniref:DUF1152 domain-containing protein n=1 Tax=Microbacterium sp. TaxID=51671 RepID=UPI00356A4E2C
MLYVAAGGPGDLVVARLLAATDSSPIFVSFLWQRDARCSGPVALEGAHGLEIRSEGWIARPSLRGPEHCILAECLNGAFYCLDSRDLSSARETLDALRILAGGQVRVIDAGGDILCGPGSPWLRSPLLESATLRLLEDIDALGGATLSIAGVGLDNEITVEEAEERLPTTLRSAESIDPVDVRALLRRTAGLTSETSRIWMHAVLGLAGRVWTDSTGRPVSVTRDSSVIFSASASELPTDLPFRRIRSEPTTLESVNDDLVSAGFLDELKSGIDRPVTLTERQRALFAERVLPGDYVSDRFRLRTRLSERFRLALLARPLARVLEPRYG